MSDVNDRQDGWSEQVTRVLRDLYAAPSDPAYWEELEHRIMARVDAEGAPWWTVFGQWTRVGAAAATIAILASGVTAAFTTRDAEARVATEIALGDTLATSGYDRAAKIAGLTPVEVSLQYVISHY